MKDRREAGVCLRCGVKGHWAAACPEPKDVNFSAGEAPAEQPDDGCGEEPVGEEYASFCFLGLSPSLSSQAHDLNSLRFEGAAGFKYEENSPEQVYEVSCCFTSGASSEAVI
jgi:hypothetical protein